MIPAQGVIHIHLVAAVAAAAGALLSCAVSTLPGAFRPVPAHDAEPRAERLLVLRAEDHRPLGGRSSMAPSLVGLLPLVPYGRQKVAAERFWPVATHDFLGDVSQTVAADLAAARVAREVATAVTRGGAAEEGPPHALHLRLHLDEGVWHRKPTLYGLSIFGAALWLVAPVAFGDAELALTAFLEEAEGEVVGSGSFRGRAPMRQWLYTGNLNLPESFAGAYGEISPDLRAFVREAIP